MNYYNLQQSVSVFLRNERRNINYKYKKERRILGLLITTEGWYYDFIGSNFVGESLPSHCFEKDGEAYYKPSVNINFSDGSCWTTYYESREAAKKFADVMTGIIDSYVKEQN